MVMRIRSECANFWFINHIIFHGLENYKNEVLYCVNSFLMTSVDIFM